MCSTLSDHIPTVRPSTYAAAFWLVFLCVRVCGAGMVKGAAVGWKRRHVSAACTSEACHPAGQSPARLGSRFKERRNRRQSGVILYECFQRAIHAVNEWTKLTYASYFSQKVTLLILYSGLVPHSHLQHVFSEIPAMDMRVHKCLVPLGLQTFLYCLRPSLTLIANVKHI